ncbi:MAG: hypothetical protein FWH04_10310 [Oscillospiraceae bacterium]|nr:hypothetical protein [Oscillospiraceae bacterium]
MRQITFFAGMIFFVLWITSCTHVPSSENMPTNPQGNTSSFSVYEQEYTIQHENGKTYTIQVENVKSLEVGNILHIHDSISNKTQRISTMAIYTNEIMFEDVNFDGYSDIVMDISPYFGVAHELFVYDPPTNSFSLVECKGFDGLSSFKGYDGYVMNWVKHSMNHGVVQTLIWDGNTLVLELEEKYELDE